MAALNLSFAACGFLGIYHLGAAGAFLRHGDKLLGSLGACAGASAGALVAAVMITAPEKLEVPSCCHLVVCSARSPSHCFFGGSMLMHAVMASKCRVAEFITRI